jgi:hypothetical protein
VGNSGRPPPDWPDPPAPPRCTSPPRPWAPGRC